MSFHSKHSGQTLNKCFLHLVLFCLSRLWRRKWAKDVVDDDDKVDVAKQIDMSSKKKLFTFDDDRDHESERKKSKSF